MSIRASCVALVVAASVGVATPAPSGATPVAVTPAVAYYEPLRPFELALQADLIVDGTVLAADSPCVWRFSEEARSAVFTVRVNALVAGECSSSEVEVRQFANWICASRYAPYRVGQRSLLHLAYARDDDGEPLLDRPLSVLSAGNEGECPISGERVFSSADGWKEVEPRLLPIGDDEYFGVAAPLSDYTAAVAGLRRCFRWERAPDDALRFARGGPRQTCTDEELTALKRSSGVARRLVHGVNAHLRALRLRAER